ncbi:sigma-54-dependent transcriptional regulator [Rhizomicrobium electricum]|uniref:Sigma-54 dependent transcriptional regulator n=1 Tax=Rhizomicrobium electricum TaxID=480070 RepID=A0ABN1EJZ1_9PROT|nr:sigma-54 dependent transcriptional regulator [Rhizomicrobium electricum]NIJ47165.1 DNA-binding NtrC family response regulator [Rhizomicrobium electricum]
MNSLVNPARILVVDDEEDVLLAARLLLKRHFASVETTRNPADLPEKTRQGSFDVLLLDMNFARGADSGVEGLSWLARVLVIDPQAVVVLVTAHGDMELAVKAMKQGAADFVVKPWENERLIATLVAAANLSRARSEAGELRTRTRGLAAATHSDSALIGGSPAMRKVFDLIRKAAPTSANVLILGENGTGKELVAREIHRQSVRASEVFLRVDLGSVSAALFESELFGHRRGAFTDAKDDRIGRFRAATGGTLFLDEIGNVPLHLQTKLLTALERREVVPVGSDRAEAIDVRLISATNLPPQQLADERVFRTDLLYRINTVEITLPPLRQRREDIPLLLEHFIALYAQKYNLPRKRLTADALERLTAFDWPGNVRALRHAVERAVILSEGTALEAEDFSLPREPRPAQGDAANDGLNLGSVERNTIQQALSQHEGNVSRAAQSLGLTRASLYRRMQKYGL